MGEWPDLSAFAEGRQHELSATGNDSRELPHDARQALDGAAEALAEVLELEPIERLPREHLADAVMLGRIHVDRQDWENATDTFSSAARAADLLLADVEVNEQELRDVLSDLGDLATVAPFVAIASGDVEQALEMAEIAKTRLMAKAQTLEALLLPPEELRAIDGLQKEIKKHETKLASPLLIDRLTPLEEVMRSGERSRHQGF